MKAQELTVTVNAKLDVEESTARACLKLVEIYLNAHSNIRLMSRKVENGETELRYELARTR